MVDQLVDQQCYEQFSVQPGAGAVVVALGQVAEPGQRLEALEDEFDLPAQAVPFASRALKLSSQNVVKTMTKSA